MNNTQFAVAHNNQHVAIVTMSLQSVFSHMGIDGFTQKYYSTTPFLSSAGDNTLESVFSCSTYNSAGFKDKFHSSIKGVVLSSQLLHKKAGNSILTSPTHSV